MHALRHFYASTLLARAVSIKELADYLGHSDPGFTLRTYVHLMDEGLGSAGFLDDAVAAAGSADAIAIMTRAPRSQS